MLQFSNKLGVFFNMLTHRVMVSKYVWISTSRHGKTLFKPLQYKVIDKAYDGGHILVTF